MNRNKIFMKTVVTHMTVFVLVIMVSAVVFADGGDGLKGEYFADMEFKDLKLTRIDKTIDFDWEFGSPDPSIPEDGFSVRWTGYIKPDKTDDYLFSVYSNDGERLWVNGLLLIERWMDQKQEDVALTTIHLEAGKYYEIKLEMYENINSSQQILKWAGTGEDLAPIPQANLYSTLPAGAQPVPTVAVAATSTPAATSTSEHR